MHCEISCVMKLVAAAERLCKENHHHLRKPNVPCDVSNPPFCRHRLRSRYLSPQARRCRAVSAYVAQFSCPDGRITIDFAFKDGILDIPIFRRSKRSLEGVNVDSFRALSANSISYWTKRLGERAGFDHPFQPYALRKEVGTELTAKLRSQNALHVVTF